MKTSSCKAKGRRACAEVRKLLLHYAPHLKPDDVRVTPSGVTGEDIQLSPAAREVYPMSIEVKNQEKLNVWSALEQAQSHVGATEYFPTLFFTKNKTKMYVAMPANDFFQLIAVIKGDLT